MRISGNSPDSDVYEGLSWDAQGLDLGREARAVRVASMLAEGGADGASLVASLLADAAASAK